MAKDYLAERSALTGSCAEATHVLRRVMVGAFEIKSGDELLDSAGDMDGCARQGGVQCRIALEVTLAPLR